MLMTIACGRKELVTCMSHVDYHDASVRREDGNEFLRVKWSS